MNHLDVVLFFLLAFVEEPLASGAHITIVKEVGLTAFLRGVVPIEAFIELLNGTLVYFNSWLDGNLALHVEFIEHYFKSLYGILSCIFFLVALTFYHLLRPFPTFLVALWFVGFVILLWLLSSLIDLCDFLTLLTCLRDFDSVAQVEKRIAVSQQRRAFIYIDERLQAEQRRAD